MCNKEDGNYQMDTRDSWDDGPDPLAGIEEGYDDWYFGPEEIDMELVPEDPHAGYCDFCGRSESECLSHEEWLSYDCPRCENFKCTCEVDNFAEELERGLSRTRDPKKAQRRIHSNRLSRSLA